MKKIFTNPLFYITMLVLFVLFGYGSLLFLPKQPEKINIQNTYLLNHDKLLYELNDEIKLNTTGNEVRKMLRYAVKNNISNIVIEIHSLGGNLYESIRIANSLIYWSKNHGNIETRVIGYAMSGGFLVFLAGDDRYVAENCYLMWHDPYIPKRSKAYTKKYYPEKMNEMEKISKFNKIMADDYINDRINIDIEKKLEGGTWIITAKEAQERKIAKIMKYQGNR